MQFLYSINTAQWKLITVLFCYISLETYVHGTRRVDMSAKCGEIEPLAGLESMHISVNSSAFQKREFHCTLTLKADAGHRFMIQLKNLQMTSSGVCNADWLNIYDAMSITNRQIVDYKFCGYVSSGTLLTTSSNTATIYFHGNQNIQNAKFDAIVTQYHTGACASNEYSCNNGRCVDASVRSDGYNPCGDHSDGPTSTNTAGITVGAIVFGLLMITLSIIVERR